MNFTKKKSAIISLVFLILIFIFIGIAFLLSPDINPAHNPHTEDINSSRPPQEKTVSKPKPTLITSSVYHESINNINSYLYGDEKRQYTEALRLAKIMFPKVPTTLIYTTSITESDLNPRAKHPNHSDHGLCGINFKYNGEDLIRAGIIKCEADLNKIGPNILACAYLYNRFLISSSGKVYHAIILYKGTNVDGRCNNLYSLYKSVVYKVTVSNKS